MRVTSMREMTSTVLTMMINLTEEMRWIALSSSATSSSRRSSSSVRIGPPSRSTGTTPSETRGKLQSWCQPNFYRSQRSWAKVMFLQASVILSTGGGVSASMHARIPPPPGVDTPSSEQNPPGSRPLQSRHPPGADTPWSRRPPGADIPREAGSGILSMSGRYASYWNAFL